MQPRVSLIFPAYNEAGRIENTLRETIDFFTRRKLSYEIIVAADGDDNTRDIVRGMAAADSAIRVIGQSERRGKGRGIREAVTLATGAIVGYVDADNKVPIDEFNKVEPWLREGYDVVIGSRASTESSIERKQPLYRQVGATGFRVFMHTVVGLTDVQDTQCGFKFFPAAVAKALFAAQKVDGYMFDVEILALASKWGYRIKSVPIRWRDDGDSRLDLIAGNIRNAIDIFRIRFSLADQAAPQPARTSVQGR